VEARLEVVKLDIVARVTALVILLFEIIVAISLLSSFFIFINLGIAFWLNQWLGSAYAGFLWVATGQLIIWGSILLNRKLIARQFEKITVKMVFQVVQEEDVANNDEDDQENKANQDEPKKED
jgi:Na+/proline symporter